MLSASDGADRHKKYDFCVTECEQFVSASHSAGAVPGFGVLECMYIRTHTRIMLRVRAVSDDDDKLEYYDFVEKKEKGKKHSRAHIPTYYILL